MSFCSGFHILVKRFKENFSFYRLDKVRCKEALVFTNVNVAKSKNGYCSHFLVALSICLILLSN